MNTVNNSPHFCISEDMVRTPVVREPPRGPTFLSLPYDNPKYYKALYCVVGPTLIPSLIVVRSPMRELLDSPLVIV